MKNLSKDHRLEPRGLLSENSDAESHIFLFHPHTNNGFVFLCTLKFCIFILKRAPRSSWIGIANMSLMPLINAVNNLQYSN